MGWKASTVFAFERPFGPADATAGPDREASEQLARELGLGELPGGQDGLFDCLARSWKQPAIGVFAGGAIICHDKYPTALIEEGRPTWPVWFEAWPTVLAVTLHSVVNYWGFALYEQGRLVRRASGSADDPVMMDQGTPQPEELGFPVAIHSCPPDDVEDILNDWNRLPDGEGVIMRMAARALGGSRMDSTDDGRVDGLMLWTLPRPAPLTRARLGLISLLRNVVGAFSPGSRRP